MPDKFDVIALGGGSGGYVAAIRASQLGMRVAVVEERKVGGICLHQGCIPTKALLQSAALLDSLARSAAFGVTTSGIEFDYSVAARRRDEVVGTLYKGVQGLLRKNKVTVVPGHGRLTGSKSVAVVGQSPTTLEADSIILGTGSRPRPLAGVSVDGRHVITSDDALRLDFIPRSAIVLGAGAVGVEFASLWRSCGADVTVVEMAERLVPLEDAAIGDELQRQFEARGITCLVGSSVEPATIALTDAGVTMVVRRHDAELRLEADVLLLAIGRAANVEDIGVEEAGVAIDRGVVTVDDQMATSVPGIRAVGDMVGGFWLAHKAMHQGVIAAEAIVGRASHPLDPRLIARTTYCTPQIASLGLSEAEAVAAGRDVRVGVMPFRGNGRAVIWGETGGFCKVVADGATDDVLGVHLIGHEVTELIQGPALGALLEYTPFELGGAVAPHPTLSEVLGEAALAVSGQAIHV